MAEDESEMSWTTRTSGMLTYSVFLLPRKLTWCLEIDAKESHFTFVGLADILDRVDMERHNITMNRKDNRLGFPVDKDLRRHVNEVTAVDCRVSTYS